MKDECIFCNSICSSKAENLIVNISCSLCGRYSIEHSVKIDFDITEYSNRQITNVSGWLNENHGHLVTRSNLTQLLSIKKK